MDHKKWLAALLVAFIAGYFSNDFINGKSTNVAGKSVEANTKHAEQPRVTQPELNTIAAPIEISSTVSIEKKQPKLSNNFPAEESANNKQAQATSKASNENAIGNSQSSNKESEISDEEIDKLVPAPFNQSLKNHHGDIREKFKEYANTETSDEWSLGMQHKISDFVFSNPYSKYVSLEFINCKADLCELRLYEKKKGTWSHISAEMALQDWWDIGGSSASGDAVDGKPGITAWYILFQKK